MIPPEISKLLESGFDLEKEYENVARTLESIGLSSYEAKGFAISTRGRPTIFKPEAPAKIKEKVVERLGESFDKLEMMHEILRDKGEPQLVYTVAGVARVLEKIGELLDTCTDAFIIATPTMHEIRENLTKKLESAI